MKVAILGATGAVGREMIKDLADSPFSKHCDVHLFASPRSAGASLPFKEKTLHVKPFSLEALQGFTFALSSISSSFSREWGEKLAAQGTIMIDNSSAFRMHAHIPLVVPEVNINAVNIKDKSFPNIIANPNCSTIPLAMSLLPLEKTFGVKKVFVSTYQSVSGAGQKGMSELEEQSSAYLQGEGKSLKPKHFKQPIAFNIIPAIDVMDGAGHCFEEEKVVRESRKILGMPELEILVTTARVPTFNCHCEAVTVELAREVTREEVTQVFRDCGFLEVDARNEPEYFPSNYLFKGKKGVGLGRVRLPLEKTKSNFVQFWLVIDNLKKGAATNAVEIFDKLYPQFQ